MVTINSTPAYDHIVVVVEENHSYGEIIGSAQAPYINSLASHGAVLANYHAVTHPSEPNYYALYSGSTFGVADDNVHAEPDPTLATILQGAGDTFTGYVDPGSPSKHNPWESFPEGTSVEKNFSAFPTSDFSALPDVSFVIPNLNNDMHDGTIAQADQWLSTNLSAYAQWATTHHSLLMVVWDEDDSSQGNQIPGILYGANINPGTYGDAYTHYDVLNTLLGAFALTAPNNGALASGLGNGIFSMGTSQWAASVDIGLHPAGSQPIGVGDFNHDGTSDVLWYNSTTRDAEIWQISNGHWAASIDIGTHPAGSQPITVGDFNHDGTSDVLWFNATSGDTEVWQISNGHWAATADLGTHPAGWQPAGIGDFNHDGTSDILWQQTSTGHLETWLLA